jgi:hypothetical protein
MTWSLNMVFTNYQGWEVSYWWPIFKTYNECRSFADLLAITLEQYNGAHVIYALCNQI